MMHHLPGHGVFLGITPKLLVMMPVHSWAGKGPSMNGTVVTKTLSITTAYSEADGMLPQQERQEG